MDFRKQSKNTPPADDKPVEPEKAASGNSLGDRVGAAIGNSAEYAVAIALLAVVGVVGGATWFLVWEGQPAKSETAVTAAPADSAAPPAQTPEEKAALAEWEKILASETRPPPPKRVEKPVVPEPAPVAAPAPAPVTPAPVAPPPVAMVAPKPAPVRVPASFDRNSCRPPKYPDSAAQKGEEGQVVMGFLLDVSGRVTDSRIEQSSGSRLLDQSALTALGRCKFTAASVDGVKQPGWMQVRFKWKLGA